MTLRCGLCLRAQVVLTPSPIILFPLPGAGLCRGQQSSILAQYILLLLTDYCTKGYCNPSDQNFAIEMGRQGIKEGKNISLYAVSKAMGFIPRNKLGHAFFRYVYLRGCAACFCQSWLRFLACFDSGRPVARSCPMVNRFALVRRLGDRQAASGKQHARFEQGRDHARELSVRSAHHPQPPAGSPLHPERFASAEEPCRCVHRGRGREHQDFAR